MNSPIDLRRENVQKYASQIPGLSIIMSEMESVESWVALNERDNGFNDNLRLALFSLDESQLQSIYQKKNELLWLLFFLPTSVSFYLLDCLAQSLEELQSMMLEFAIQVLNDNSHKDTRHAQVFVDRCSHLNSGNFLHTITSESFTRSLLRSIQIVRERSGDVY